MLSELAALEALIAQLPACAEKHVLTQVSHGSQSRFPVYGLTIGSKHPQAPVCIVVAGIHGLEKIGTRVALSFLTTLLELAQWDQSMQELLERVRIVMVPLTNPVGMMLSQRANGNGVDLMRNAPWNPEGQGTFMVGGQRVSRFLPWYVGTPGKMERESAAMLDFVLSNSTASQRVISIDLHSGYGTVDRIWFPYAYTNRTFHHLAEMRSLVRLLDRTLPHHVYRFEPQSTAYLAQGDLWDYCYDTYRTRQPNGIFLPLTLEMGSWIWVRKNPRQLLHALGAFNPVMPHREKRTLRRHLLLLDFLLRAVGSHAAWTPSTQDERILLHREASELWYPAS